MYSIVQLNLMSGNGHYWLENIDTLMSQLEQIGMPDVLCFQEVSYGPALHLLKGKLKDYYMVTSDLDMNFKNLISSLDKGISITFSKNQPAKHKDIYTCSKGRLLRTEYLNGLVIYSLHAEEIDAAVMDINQLAELKHTKKQLLDSLTKHLLVDGESKMALVTGDFGMDLNQPQGHSAVARSSGEWLPFVKDAWLAVNSPASNQVLMEDRFERILFTDKVLIPKEVYKIGLSDTANHSALYAKFDVA